MKKIIYSAAAMLFVAASLTSCLKDNTMVLDPDKAGSNVIEFQNPTEIAVHGSTTALYVMSYPIIPTATTVPITIQYAGAEDGAPQDITVNFGLGPQTAIDQYNTEQGRTGASGTTTAPYLMMPASWYTINATSVTIPKGQKSATFTISLKTDQILLNDPYVVPVRITAATGGATISKNFSTVLLNFGAKNKYDGVYKYTTSATTSLQPNLNKSNISLITVDATTVRVAPGLLATYSNPCRYIVDPNTNLVTVWMDSLLPIATNPISKYDPATKTFTLKWTSNGGARTFEETYVYTGARP